MSDRVTIAQLKRFGFDVAATTIRNREGRGVSYPPGIVQLVMRDVLDRGPTTRQSAMDAFCDAIMAREIKPYV